MSEGDEIPIVSWFVDNPLGVLVALVMFFMLLLMFQSNLPTNPFLYAGAGGSSTVDYSSANFLSLWGTVYSNTSWYLTLALPFFFIAMIFEHLREQRLTREGYGSAETGSPGPSNLASRLRSARIGGLKRPQRPTTTIILDQRRLPQNRTLNIGRVIGEPKRLPE